MKLIGLSAALAAFYGIMLTASPVLAVEQPRMSQSTQSDLQCLISIMSTSANIEKLSPGSSQAALMYYFGRLDADDSELDLEAAIRWQLPLMTPKDIAAADMRCGKLLQARGKVMQTVGQHLQADPGR